jgi:hypothetical protein
VTIENGSGTTALTLDDFFDATGRNVTLNGSGISGLTPAAVHFATGRPILSALTLYGGNGNDTFTVSSTPDLASGSILLNTGGGTDSVSVRTTAAPLAINGNRGNDTVKVGNGGSLQGLLAPLTFDNHTGLFAVTLDDAADPLPRAVTLTSGNVSGLAPAAINFVTAYPVVNALTINGGSGGNRFTIAGDPAVASATLNAGNGSDTVTVQIAAPHLSVNGNAGSNTLIGPDGLANAWTLSGAGSGTLNGGAFTGFDNLRGGAGNDSFQFAANGMLAGGIDGGGGSNSLDFSASSSTVLVNLATGVASHLNGGNRNGFTHIQQFVGSKATGLNYLDGPSTATTYTLSAATAGRLSSGQAFSGFERLVGSGNDTLLGPNLTALWSLTGSNAGWLSAGGTAMFFSGFPNLTGGSGDDTYHFVVGASLSGNLSDGGGHNWLDYSAFRSAVTINLTAGTATGVGGTVSGIQNALGGTAADTMTGSAAGGILIGGAGNDTISAGAGRAILIGDTGADTLNAGTNGDILIGGTTTYDLPTLNQAALLAVLAEWQRTDVNYTTRVSDLKNGTGLTQGNKLTWTVTVKDDGSANTETGNAAASGNEFDWFFANQAAGHDRINNLLPGEQVD